MWPPSPPQGGVHGHLSAPQAPATSRLAPGLVDAAASLGQPIRRQRARLPEQRRPVPLCIGMGPVSSSSSSLLRSPAGFPPCSGSIGSAACASTPTLAAAAAVPTSVVGAQRPSTLLGLVPGQLPQPAYDGGRLSSPAGNSSASSNPRASRTVAALAEASSEVSSGSMGGGGCGGYSLGGTHRTSSSSLLPQLQCLSREGASQDAFLGLPSAVPTPSQSSGAAPRHTLGSLPEQRRLPPLSRAFNSYEVEASTPCNDEDSEAGASEAPEEKSEASTVASESEEWEEQEFVCAVAPGACRDLHPPRPRAGGPRSDIVGQRGAGAGAGAGGAGGALPPPAVPSLAFVPASFWDPAALPRPRSAHDRTPASPVYSPPLRRAWRAADVPRQAPREKGVSAPTDAS